LKIVFISDTHGLHEQLEILEGDMIIHGGDISNRGRREEVEDFIDWFQELNFTHKIFIAGNHDLYLERVSEYELEEIIPEDVIYLNDSGITINGINIWGSPVQPWFYDWAFNRERGEEIKKHWDLIPHNTDILITHGPPHGILDKTASGQKVGCEELRERLEIVKPKIHVFGHIHEAYGSEDISNTKYINASVLDIAYKLVNAPVEINYV